MPEELISLNDIVSHVVRQTVTIGDDKFWATIILSRVNSHLASHISLASPVINIFVGILIFGT